MISLGNTFENGVLNALGVDPMTVQPESVDIIFINPGGPTTVRYTVVDSIDSTVLGDLIRQAAPDAAA